MQTHLYDSRDVHLRYVEARKLPPGTTALWMEAIARHAPNAGAQCIADLGCGSGRFTSALGAQFRTPVIGIDLSEKMLGVARREAAGSGVRFLRAGAEAIPLADGIASLVFVSMVYHHFTDRGAALREIRRILLPRGCCAIRTCSLENLDSFLYQRFFPTARQVDLDRLESRDTTIQTLLAAGFQRVAVETIRQITADSMDAYLRKIEQRGTSDLEAISDAEFAAGMRQLRDFAASFPKDQPIEEELDLLVFRPAF